MGLPSYKDLPCMRLQQLGDLSVLLVRCRMSRYDAFTSWSTCTLRMHACRPLFPALEPSHVQAVTMLLLVAGWGQAHSSPEAHTGPGGPSTGSGARREEEDP